MILAVITLILGRLLVWPDLMSPDFGKPLGQAIPDEPPDEANRVVSPHGFSLVFPPGWEVKVAAGPAISGIPRTLIPYGRSSAAVFLKQLGEVKPEVPGYRPTLFQGKPAFERMQTRAGTFDDPPRLRYEVIFQRGQDWYELTFIASVPQTEVPPIWRRYFQTFQPRESSQHLGEPRQGVRLHPRR